MNTYTTSNGGSSGSSGASGHVAIADSVGSSNLSKPEAVGPEGIPLAGRYSKADYNNTGAAADPSA